MYADLAYFYFPHLQSTSLRHTSTLQPRFNAHSPFSPALPSQRISISSFPPIPTQLHSMFVLQTPRPHVRICVESMRKCQRKVSTDHPPPHLPTLPSPPTKLPPSTPLPTPHTAPIILPALHLTGPACGHKLPVISQY
ncbi:hypothetical protein K439DRAFT_890702 [Ramaria rubella]|nr:hypothetical protein K439DRAFT_890702 [Ramaria rubella]